MKITEEWLARNFTREKDQRGGYWTLDLIADKSLCLMSDEENGFLEVILFPYYEIRYQKTEQVEACYQAITGASMYEV